MENSSSNCFAAGGTEPQAGKQSAQNVASDLPTELDALVACFQGGHLAVGCDGAGPA